MDVILFSSCEEPAGVSSAGSASHLAGGSNGTTAGLAAGAAGAGPPAGSSTAGISNAGGSTLCSIGAAAAAIGALAAAGIAAGAAHHWVGCVVLLLAAAVGLWLCCHFNSRQRFQSVWYKPVRAYVQGGYTISPQEDCNAVNSPECLVTCILKVGAGKYDRVMARPVVAAYRAVNCALVGQGTWWGQG